MNLTRLELCLREHAAELADRVGRGIAINGEQLMLRSAVLRDLSEVFLAYAARSKGPEGGDPIDARLRGEVQL